jgi:hypothetical protein
VESRRPARSLRQDAAAAPTAGHDTMERIAQGFTLAEAPTVTAEGHLPS